MYSIRQICGGILHRIAPLIKNDETYLRWYYYFGMGKFPDLKNPKSFNEKLQWLKMHDHNPAYTQMVDKLGVKDYISKKIGQEYVVPLIGAWDKFEDIDFDKLPDKFVLKCTHDSGGLVICKDKSKLNIAEARKKIYHCLKKDYFIGTREWPYKDVKKKIIAEQLLTEPGQPAPRDYKILCFNGKPKLIELHQNRFTDRQTQDFYDTSWKRTSISQGGWNGVSKSEAPKPENLDQMLTLSETLAEGTACMRVDWYDINGKLYFGEITFYDGSGIDAFDDYNDDLKMGSWIDLNLAYGD